MPAIELKDINNFICRNIKLKVEDKELLVLLGPTGAGKTTMLNIIAGLIEYEGSVFFDGVSMDKLLTSQRGVGYLFQDLFLFPHLDVISNITYGLNIQKKSRLEMQAKLSDLLRLMRIEHLSHRYPRDLSGGEKQRVALARALAPSPKVLLLDEPLRSLDFRTSRYLRVEFRRLQREIGITTMYVTHDLIEAEEMADRIAVIYDGRLEQVGTPWETFFNPGNEKVSGFIGEPNILNCEYCKPLGQGLMEVGCGGIPILVPHSEDVIRKIAISPRDIYVSTNELPGHEVNRFKGIITEVIPCTYMVRLKIKVGKNILLAELDNEIGENLDLRIGRWVFLILKLKWIRVC